MQDPISVAATWQKTFERLSPTAASILRLAAFLAPEPIAQAMFEEGEKIVREAVELLCQETGQKAGEESIQEGIAELAACSMIDRDGEMFTIPLAVQQVVRDRIPEESRKDWLERSLRAVYWFAPFKGEGTVSTWPVWDLLRPHAVEVIKLAEESGITDPTSRLMNQLGLFLHAKGLYQEAEPLMRRALDIDEQDLGPQDPDVARCLNNLALILKVTNRLEEAESLMRRALDINEQAFGPRHAHVASNLNNLARLLGETNRFSEAEPLIRRALDIDEQALRSQRLRVATRLDDLAVLLQDVDRLAEAEPLLRRVVEIDEESQGSDPPKTRIFQENLAEIRADPAGNGIAGRQRARPSPPSAAATWQTFERLSPTAASILRLAAFLAPEPIAQAMFEEGEKIVREAVELLCRETGQEAGEESIQEGIAELAACSMIDRDGEMFTVPPMVQQVVRDRIPEESRKDWLERSLRVVRWFAPFDADEDHTWPVWDPLRPHAVEVIKLAEESGITHPTTGLMNQLGLFLHAKGLYQEAESLMRRALEIDEQDLGPQDPVVAIRLDNLALLLQSTNRLEEAEPLMRRVLDIDEQDLGPDDPQISTDLSSLARLLRDMKRPAEAEPLIRRALDIEEQALRSQLLRVATRLNNLAVLLQDMDRLAEAEPLMRRAVEIGEESQESDHPKIRLLQENLAGLLATIEKQGGPDSESSERSR